MKPKLIIIEGLPGTGKTTTSKWISNHLSNSNISNEWFYEFDTKCPIFSDPHKGFTNSGLWKKETLHGINWDEFVNYISRLNCIGVFESKFWQNYGLFLFLTGYSKYDILQKTTVIYDKIKQLNPLLIYLRTQNVHKHMIEVLEERRYIKQGSTDYNFTEWFVNGLNNSVWFKKNQKCGEEGVIDFMYEWSKICDKLYDKFPYSKLEFFDVRLNWSSVELKIKNITHFNKSTKGLESKSNSFI